MLDQFGYNPFAVPCGVYEIKCLADGRIYIGSSKNVYTRIHTHWLLLKKNRHQNTKMQAAWNEHGENQFVWRFLEICQSSKRFDREMDYISNSNPDTLFNRRLGVHGTWIEWLADDEIDFSRKRNGDELE